GSRDITRARPRSRGAAGPGRGLPREPAELAPRHREAPIVRMHAEGDGRIVTGAEDLLRGVRHQPSLMRTYSNSTGCAFTPRAGGAIQFANLPGSVTGFVITLRTSASA